MRHLAIAAALIIPSGASASDVAMQAHMMEEARVFYMVRGEADAADAEQGTLVTWDAEAWIGGDDDKLWLKSEGEHFGGETEQAEFQALYSRNVSTFWDFQAGVRYDVEPAGTAYAVIGVQGLAPYFFETEAHLFVSGEGETSARFKQSLDLLLTQRLILEPHIELNAYARDVPERGMGAGLSDIEAGLQLRFEVTRKFAPYVDFVWESDLGETATITHASGGSVEDMALRAGLRFWF